MLLTAFLMKWMLYAESSGTVFTIHKTKGLTGSVYQRIPEVGQGKIHIVVDGITREILAQAQDGVSIESFVLVQVVKVIDYEIVEVIALRKDHQ